MLEKSITRTRPTGLIVFTLALLLINIGGAYFAMSGSPTNVIESPLRVVLAGIIVMLLPGMIVGQFFGIKASHPLEALAKALALSLTIALVFALACFVLKVPIIWWVMLILTWNAIWTLLVLFYRRKEGLMQGFLEGFKGKDRRADILFMLFLVFLSIGLYRWGDDITGIDWEVALHLTYMRQYVSDLPLDFIRTALRPDLALPNLFFFWEFLLAGISRVAGLDPLISALRSRWLVPFLGFSAFFFMSLHLTGSLKKARQITWITFIASVMQFIYLAPNAFVTSGIVTDPLRGITAFTGSIHHSDTAMEILLPLVTAYLFMFLRRGGLSPLVALGGMLLVSFFWHPREYFQVMWYGCIAFVTALISELILKDRGIFRRYLPLMALFLIVAVSLFLITIASTEKGSSMRGNELKWKSDYSKESLKSLSRWKDLKSREPLFRFAIHGLGAPRPNPPHVFSWLIMAALLLPAIVLASSRNGLWVAMFYVLLWFFTLSYHPTQKLLSILTYTEILMTKPRFLPLFACSVMGLGWFALVKLVYGAIGFIKTGILRRILWPAVFLGMGGLFAIVWGVEAPYFSHLIPVLTWSVALSTVGLFIALNPYIQWHQFTKFRERLVALKSPGIISGALAFVLFLLPVCGESSVWFIKNLVSRNVDMKVLFSRDNPPGVSEGMIRTLREDIPPRTHILVEPLGTQMVGIYAPVYLVPYPKGNVMLKDAVHRQMAQKGQHPVFNARPCEGPTNIEEIEVFLNQHKIEYILAGSTYIKPMQCLIEKYPDMFRAVYKSPENKDILIKYTARK